VTPGTEIKLSVEFYFIYQNTSITENFRNTVTDSNNLLTQPNAVDNSHH